VATILNIPCSGYCSKSGHCGFLEQIDHMKNFHKIQQLIFILLFVIFAFTALQVRAQQPTIEQIEAALAINPDNQDALLQRSFLFIKEKAFDKAIADAKRVAQLDPKNKFAYRFIGVSQLNLAEYKDALANLDLAVANSPDDMEAIFYRGNAYLKLGNDAAAFQDLSKVAEKNKNMLESYYLLAGIAERMMLKDLKFGKDVITYLDHILAIADPALPIYKASQNKKEQIQQLMQSANNNIAKSAEAKRTFENLKATYLLTSMDHKKWIDGQKPQELELRDPGFKQKAFREKANAMVKQVWLILDEGNKQIRSMIRNDALVAKDTWDSYQQEWMGYEIKYNDFALAHYNYYNQVNNAMERLDEQAILLNSYQKDRKKADFNTLKEEILKGLNANVVLITEAITKLRTFPTAIGYNQIKAEYELLALMQLKMSKDLLERKY